MAYKKNPNIIVERRARSRFYERQMRAGRVENPCVTRGMSYTHFTRNTLGKDLLDRCGRELNKRPDTSNEATFDEIREYGVGIA